MARPNVAAEPTSAVGDLASTLRLYERSLRAANRAEPTVYKYLLNARQLIEFLTDVYDALAHLCGEWCSVCGWTDGEDRSRHHRSRRSLPTRLSDDGAPRDDPGRDGDGVERVRCVREALARVLRETGDLTPEERLEVGP
jgi:hypothetical protein